MRSSLLVLLFPLSALPACSATLEVLATADTEGVYGAQVTLEIGIGVAHIDRAQQVEVGIEEGLAVDGAPYGLVGFNAAYSDARLGDDEGLGHRVGLHLDYLIELDPDRDAEDQLLGVGVSWSLLGTLDGYSGGLPHTGLQWYTRDQLGVTLYAAQRFQVGRGSKTRTVFGIGPRYTLLLNGR